MRLAAYEDEEGWWSRTIRYGDALYAARCPECARFVKTDPTALRHIEHADLREPNATCRKHGRVRTPFLAWWGDCN